MAAVWVPHSVTFHWNGRHILQPTHAPGVEVVEHHVGEGDGGDDPQVLQAQPEHPDDDARPEEARGGADVAHVKRIPDGPEDYFVWFGWFGGEVVHMPNYDV